MRKGGFQNNFLEKCLNYFPCKRLIFRGLILKSSKDDGGCDQICSNTKGSYNCRCRAGYYLDDDDHTCVDANECDCDSYDPKLIAKIRKDSKFRIHQ